MRPIYYNVYDGGRRLGTYTATELQTMIHCGRQIPKECADTGRLFRARYTFERIDGCEYMSLMDLSAEWDKARLRILRAAKK